MQRRLVDAQRNARTMDNTGGEDTALLRSNRSARAGAGTRAGVCPIGSLLPSPMTAMRSGHKAINLGVWGRAPRQHLRPLRHMSRCVRRESSRTSVSERIVDFAAV
jgi:hypothetical protein